MFPPPIVKSVDVIIATTLRQNIDKQIAEAQTTIALLNETKTRLEAFNILDARIDDIQRALQQ